MFNVCHSFDLSLLPERHVSSWKIFGISQLKEKQITENLESEYTKVRIMVYGKC